MKLFIVTVFLLSSSLQADINADISLIEKLYRSGQIDAARKKTADFVVNNETPQGYVKIGSLFARLKKWPESVHYLEIAANRDEKNPVIWYQLGLAYHQNRQIDNAVSALRKSVSLKPAGEKAIFALGEVLELANDRYD